MKTDDLDRMDATARNGSAWPESTQSRADVLTLTAEVRRLMAALADEERASEQLLTERDRLTEAIDAIHAMTGCTHEWSNLHSCDACAVEGVGAMVAPGVHDEGLRRVRVALRAFGVADCDDPLAALEAVAADVPRRESEATEEHNAAVRGAHADGWAEGLEKALAVLDTLGVGQDVLRRVESEVSRG